MAYTTNAARLEPGSIVKVENPLASSGKPTYPHYFIVLSVPEPLKTGDVIPLVGISSRIDPKPADPAKHVSMKWMNRIGGHPETGFSKPCHACMDFTHLLKVKVHHGDTHVLEVAAQYNGKRIGADKLQTVVATMNAWTRRK